MTPADRAQALHEEADAIATDTRYGRIYRTVTAAVLHTRAERIEKEAAR